MNLIDKHVLVLELTEQLRNKGSWCGETHLQKAVYFLQELLAVPMDFEFVLYKHGPFSFELKDELALLRAYELLELEPQPNGYGPKLGLSDPGLNFKIKFSEKIKLHHKKIEWLADHLGTKGVVNLERLGTALYVSREEEMSGKSDDEIIARIVEFKPHISPELAATAFREVRQMELESKAIME